MQRCHVAILIHVGANAPLRGVWVADLDTRAAGFLYVGTKKTAKSLVKTLVKDWRDNGHL